MNTFLLLRNSKKIVSFIYELIFLLSSLGVTK